MPPEGSARPWPAVWPPTDSPSPSSISTRPPADPWSTIEAAGGRAIAIGADVADEAAVEAAVERVAAELGAPTVLVNNAGVIRDNLLFKMTADDWDTVHERAPARRVPDEPGGARST